MYCPPKGTALRTKNEVFLKKKKKKVYASYQISKFFTLFTTRQSRLTRTHRL